MMLWTAIQRSKADTIEHSRWELLRIDMVRLKNILGPAADRVLQKKHG